MQPTTLPKGAGLTKMWLIVVAGGFGWRGSAWTSLRSLGSFTRVSLGSTWSSSIIKEHSLQFRVSLSLKQRSSGVWDSRSWIQWEGGNAKETPQRPDDVSLDKTISWLALAAFISVAYQSGSNRSKRNVYSKCAHFENTIQKWWFHPAWSTKTYFHLLHWYGNLHLINV